MSTHPLDKIRSRYRYNLRAMRNLEKAFDQFMRANRDNHELRKSYADNANKEYFTIKARLTKLREMYQTEAYFNPARA